MKNHLLPKLARVIPLKTIFSATIQTYHDKEAFTEDLDNVRKRRIKVTAFKQSCRPLRRFLTVQIL